MAIEGTCNLADSNAVEIASLSATNRLLIVTVSPLGSWYVELADIASYVEGTLSDSLAGSDEDAIHDNVAGEIAAITEKTAPSIDDWLLIEDSIAGDAKKRIRIGSLSDSLGGSDEDAIHDNVAGEIILVTEKVTPASADVLLIEDSAADNAKKRVQIGNLPGEDSLAGLYGILPLDQGGTGQDFSAVGQGDLLIGTGGDGSIPGALAILDGSAANDGDVLTMQADGLPDWEEQASVGGSEWTDGGSFLYPTDNAGAKDVVIGQNTVMDSARLSITKDGLPLSIECSTDAASTLVAVVHGNDRAVGVNGDTAQWQFYMDNSDGDRVEIARFRWVITDVTPVSESGRFDLIVTDGAAQWPVFYASHDFFVLASTLDLWLADLMRLPKAGGVAPQLDGELGLFTTVSDWSHGIIKYYSGEELFILAMPVAQLSPSDGQVPAYNATNDEMEFVSMPSPEDAELLALLAMGV